MKPRLLNLERSVELHTDCMPLHAMSVEPCLHPLHAIASTIPSICMPQHGRVVNVIVDCVEAHVVGGKVMGNGAAQLARRDRTLTPPYLCCSTCIPPCRCVPSAMTSAATPIC